MNDFLRMCFNIITQIGPYLVIGRRKCYDNI